MGKALSFDGGDYVTIGQTNFPSGTSARTISTWAKLAVEPTGYMWIAAYGTASASQAFFIGYNADKIYCGGFGNDITYTVDLAPYVGKWMQVTCAYDGTNAALYLNGVQVVAPTAKTWSLVLNKAYIGRQVNDAEYFNGAIDEVMVFNTALSAADVNNLYNFGVVRYDVNRSSNNGSSWSNAASLRDVNTLADTSATDAVAPSAPSISSVGSATTSSLDVAWNSSTDAGADYNYVVSAFDNSGNESNYVLNSGFEKGLLNWAATNDAGGVFSLGTDNAYTGNYSLKAIKPANGGFPGRQQSLGTLLAGKTVLVSGWMKSAAGTAGCFYISISAQGIVCKQNIPTIWTYYSGVATISPSGSSALSIYMDTAPSGTIWYDDIKVREIKSTTVTSGLKQYFVNCVSSGSCAAGNDAIDKVVSGATTTTVSGLDVNTSYCFTALGTDYADNNSSASSQSCKYTLANVPSAPTVNGAAATTLNVTINVNSNPTATQFAVYNATTSQYVQANGSLGASAIWQTNATWGTKTVTGLSGGTQYCFKVKARNGDAVETALSDQTCAYTTISAPSITATADSAKPRNSASASVDVNWSDISGEDNYTLYRSTDGAVYSNIATVAQNGTGYTNTSLSDNTLYYYILQANNASAGDQNSNTATAFTPDRTAPTNSGDLSGPYALDQVNLTWSKGSDNNSAQAALDYNVMRSTTAIDSNASYSTLTRLDDAASYSDTSGTDDANPNAPTISGVTADSTSQLTVSWGAVTDNATTYYYKVKVIDVQSNDSNTNSITVSANSGLSRYWDTDVSTSAIDLNTAAASYVKGSLDVNSSHCFTVKAADRADNNSTASAQSCKFTLANAPSISSISCTPYTCTVNINMNSNPVGTDLNVVVTQGTASGGTNSGWFKSDASPESYADSGLTAGTQYCYIVYARNGDNVATAASAESCAYTTLEGSITLTATAQTDKAKNSSLGKIALSWNDIAGETGYDVFRSTNGSTFTKIASALAAGTASYNDDSLSDNTLYYYIVQAISSNPPTDDVNSNTTSARTYDRTAPSIISSLSGSYSLDQIDLSWSKATDNVDAQASLDYNVLRSTTAIDSNASYSILSRLDDASSYSDTSGTDDANPDAPTISGINADSSTQLTISWGAVSDNGSTYYYKLIAIDTNSNDSNSNSVSASALSGISRYWVTNATTSGIDLNSAAASYAASSLDVNAQYCFTVKSADRADSTSSASAQSCKYTLANVPGAPTVSQTASPNTLTVSLNVNSNPAATQFAIYDINQAKYVQANGSLNTDAVWQINSAWGTVTVTGLTANSQHCFQVKARNGDLAETTLSAQARATTLGVQSPTNLSATFVDAYGLNSGKGNVSLGWNDNSAAETGNYVYRSTDNTTFINIFTTAADATSYTDTNSGSGLRDNRMLWYIVGAFVGSTDANSDTANVFITDRTAPSQVSLTVTPNNA